MRHHNYHLRDQESRRFRNQRLAPEFRDYLNAVLVPTLRLDGRKLKTKAELAGQIISNLILTGRRFQVVADSRDTAAAGNRIRIQVWNAIIAAGYAEKCLGSEASGLTTRYSATEKLMRIFGDWDLGQLLDRHLAKNTILSKPTFEALLVLHSGTKDLKTGKRLPENKQKQLLPFPKVPTGLSRYIGEIEDEIERINAANLRHAWVGTSTDPETEKTRTFQPDVCLRRIDSGWFGRGGRLYTSGLWSAQGIPKKQRESIQIDGQPVAELDFSGYATRMLYHIEDADKDVTTCPDGDVYLPELVFPTYYASPRATERGKARLRNLVKRATNICWNVDSERKAVGSVIKILKEHPKPKLMRRIVFDVEQTTPKGIIQRIKRSHPKLEHRFFSEVGILLMSIDGYVMLEILGRFANKRKPALGIHDSVLCKASDVQFARKAMNRVYRKYFFGFSPVIFQTF